MAAVADDPPAVAAARPRGNFLYCAGGRAAVQFSRHSGELASPRSDPESAREEVDYVVAAVSGGIRNRISS